MIPVRPPFPIAVAVLRAFALAAAVSGVGGVRASPGLLAAELGGVPTSPGFKMDLNKSKTGAPEGTAIGATPIEMKASATASKASAADGEHRDKPGEKTAGKTQGKSGAKSADKGSEKGREKGSDKDSEKGLDKVAEKAGDKPSDKPNDQSAAAAASASASEPMDPMDLLRQKLADRLGAKSGAGGKFALRVSNRGESGENVVTAVHIGTDPRPATVRRLKHAASGAGTAASGALLPTQWDYAGAGGPDAWARLQPANDRCATGTRQSPIDIRGGIAVDLEPIKFEYHASAFSVVDNGHTVQVNVAPGNFITVTGHRYELVQFHFHRPSEERINGRQFDMVAHLVHKDAAGRLAVVAVLLDRGSAQAIVQTVWNNLPLEKGDEVKAEVEIDLARLLPEDQRYYTYMGSMTTPPCSEGVLWMVMKQPVAISPEQLAIFSRLYPMNARPIQQADGRLIKESN